MNENSNNMELLACPCCGTRMFSIYGDYEICHVCNWEDDPVQASNPDFAGGANHPSLNDARKDFEKFRKGPDLF